MFLTAEIELDEKGILAQIERTRKAQSKLDNELCELRRMLEKASIKEKRDSEESQQI